MYAKFSIVFVLLDKVLVKWWSHWNQCCFLSVEMVFQLCTHKWVTLHGRHLTGRLSNSLLQPTINLHHQVQECNILWRVRQMDVCTYAYIHSGMCYMGNNIHVYTTYIGMFSSAWILWQSRNRGKSYTGRLRITQKVLQIENIKTMSAQYFEVHL